jgi:hypothetical protein
MFSNILLPVLRRTLRLVPVSVNLDLQGARGIGARF